MKGAALVLARRSLLVISICALLVTIPFVISPQLATEFGSLPLLEAMAVELKDAHAWHRVHVDGLHMDKTLVTNAEYAALVRATGYATVAERVPNAKDYPGAPPEKFVAGSVVFAPPETAVPLSNPYQWWDFVKGANWLHPEGRPLQFVQRGEKS